VSETIIVLYSYVIQTITNAETTVCSSRGTSCYFI